MTSTATLRTDLQVEGMTCASCAHRVERSLAGPSGSGEEAATVSVHVNLVTGVAHVEHAAEVDVADLVRRVEQAGYGARPVAADGPPGLASGHAHDATEGLLPRFLVAVLPTLFVVATMVPALRPPGWEWWALVLATPVALWSAAPFHRTALQQARHRAASMDTLVSIGILASWAWSVVVVLSGMQGHSYVEVAAVTTTLVLGGRLLEARARSRAGDALRNLLELSTRDAMVLGTDGTERAVPADQLGVGDLVVVRPGERIATDGTVETGRSSVDRSIVTGEPVPVPVEAGDEVLGGTTNVDGRLVVRATRVGADTAVAQVARLVTQAQAGRAQVQRLADRVSGVFVPIVIGLSLLTLAGWLLLGGSAAEAVSAAVAVLIVACPCALGLATPTALLVGSGRGAQLGIVIRGPEVLEQARRVDTVVLDKTGTITSGTFSVLDVVLAPGGGLTAEEVLALAGAVEAGSEHPIGRALAAAAAEAGALAEADDFRNHAGRGVEAVVAGQRIAVGRRALLAELDVEVPAALAERVDAHDAAATTTAWVARDGQAVGVVLLRDEPREDSAAAIAALRSLGVEVLLATGDSEPAARAAAMAVGITDVRSDLLPADKDALVTQLQADGRVVAMVGDGVNDAPALARADLGIAIGAGADVAIEASDLTLVSASLWSAVDALRLARATLRRIRRNLFWAFAYNVAAIPLAVAGLLEPMVAGAAMAASSIFVVGGSLALRRFQATPRS